MITPNVTSYRIVSLECCGGSWDEFTGFELHGDGCPALKPCHIHLETKGDAVNEDQNDSTVQAESLFSLSRSELGGEAKVFEISAGRDRVFANWRKIKEMARAVQTKPAEASLEVAEVVALALWIVRQDQDPWCREGDRRGVNGPYGDSGHTPEHVLPGTPIARAFRMTD